MHQSTHKNASFHSLWAVAALAGLAVIAPNAAHAQSGVPGTLVLEGALVSGGGGPAADGAYVATFTFYDKKTGGKVLHQDGPIQLDVKSGRFAATIGSSKAIPTDAFKDLSGAWLGVKIGNDPEFAAEPLHSVVYALRAQVAHGLECNGCVQGAAAGFNYAASDTKGGPAAKAKDLECTGCVSVSEMKFDGAVDLGANPLSAGKLTSSGDIVAAGSIAAKEFLGDGSKLSGISLPKGECSKAGEVVKGINADGTLTCVLAMDAKNLPNGGLDEISGGALTNHFTDVFEGGKGLAIPDNDSTGLYNVITVPDSGVAEDFEIEIEITKAPFVDANPKDGKPDYDPTDLSIFLFPPTTTTLPAARANIVNNFLSKPTIDATLFPHYIVHQGGGEGTLNVFWQYPKDKPVSGDPSVYVGKKLTGKWQLLILDNKERTGTSTDGQLVKWAIKVKTLGNNRVRATGDLYVDGNASVDGNLTVKKDLEIGGSLKFSGEALDGNNQPINAPFYSKNRRIYTAVIAFKDEKDCPVDKGWTHLNPNDLRRLDNHYIYGLQVEGGTWWGGLNNASSGDEYVRWYHRVHPTSTSSTYNLGHSLCFKNFTANNDNAHASMLMSNKNSATECPKGYMFIDGSRVHGPNSSTWVTWSANKAGFFIGPHESETINCGNHDNEGCQRVKWTHTPGICLRMYGVEEDPEYANGVYPVVLGMQTPASCPAGWNIRKMSDWHSSNPWHHHMFNDNSSYMGHTNQGYSYMWKSGENYNFYSTNQSYTAYMCWKYFPVTGQPKIQVITLNSAGASCPKDWYELKGADMRGVNTSTIYSQWNRYHFYMGGMYDSGSYRAIYDYSGGYGRYHTDSSYAPKICLKLHNVVGK